MLGTTSRVTAASSCFTRACWMSSSGLTLRVRRSQCEPRAERKPGSPGEGLSDSLRCVFPEPWQRPPGSSRYVCFTD